MRIPFPYALNVGTDIIAHARLLRSSRPDRFTSISKLATRFLHPREIEDLNRRFPGWETLSTPADSVRYQKLATWLAGRWAAKEAAKKAWAAHLISFRDLRVEAKSEGEVEIVCQSFNDHDNGSDSANGGGLQQVAKLSISHDGDYAVATVLATPLHPDIVAELQARKVTIPRGRSA